MFQWETRVSLGVLLVLIIVIIVPRSVFTKSSPIKLYKEDKRLLFNSDPWPPAEQKLEMPCDINIYMIRAHSWEAAQTTRIIYEYHTKTPHN